MYKNLEKQLVELQNKLIEAEKNAMSNKTELDEMSERADFYENLHNKEQRDLYDMEMKYADLKLQHEDYKSEMESKLCEVNELLDAKKREVGELENRLQHVLDEYDGRTLLKYSFKKLGKKFSRA